jgi:hypothetical protein
VVPAPTGTTLLPDGPVTRTAVVLGPVMARWDGGAFFDEVAAPLLGTGHRVTVYDTLSLLRTGDDLAALTDRWAAVVAAAGPVDLLAGNALGGAVVQAMLTREWTHRTRVVLLSGPTVADAELNGKLERVAAAVTADGLAVALRLLDDVVRGPGPRSAGRSRPAGRGEEADGSEQEEAGRRLATGLRLLHDVDAGQAVRDFPGRLLHIYGSASQLVRREHLVAGPRHGLVGIQRAGMRPHTDQPERTRHAIARFLGL